MTVTHGPEHKTTFVRSFHRSIRSLSHAKDSDILGLKPMVMSSRSSDMSHSYVV